jgi:hypothetical protein
MRRCAAWKLKSRAKSSSANATTHEKSPATGGAFFCSLSGEPEISLASSIEAQPRARKSATGFLRVPGAAHSRRPTAARAAAPPATEAAAYSRSPAPRPPLRRRQQFALVTRPKPTNTRRADARSGVVTQSSHSGWPVCGYSCVEWPPRAGYPRDDAGCVKTPAEGNDLLRGNSSTPMSLNHENRRGTYVLYVSRQWR